MGRLKIVAIAAVGKNGVIGAKNGLPWHIPEDMKFFMDATRGQIVVMGRKTYDSLGKALPKRENAVITRDEAWSRSDAMTFRSLEAAIAYFQKNFTESGKNIFVIGGAEVYRLALPLVDEIWLTEITESFEGDAFFPNYADGKLKIGELVLLKTEPKTDLKSPFGYCFNRYGRKC